MPSPVLLCDKSQWQENQPDHNEVGSELVWVHSSIHKSVFSSTNDPLALQTRAAVGGKAGSFPEAELPLSGLCCSWQEESRGGCQGFRDQSGDSGTRSCSSSPQSIPMLSSCLACT